jgi:hypothetical protein
MKKLKILSLSLVLVGTSILTSCQKEGCTDLDAVNYSSSAKKNDGSCKYEGSIVFWYGPETSSFLQSDDAITLTYYVDGQVVGSSATSVFWNSIPDCGQNSSVTVTKDLGGAKSNAYTYSIKDQTGFEYWSGVLNFSANTCQKLELN